MEVFCCEENEKKNFFQNIARLHITKSNVAMVERAKSVRVRATEEARIKLSSKSFWKFSKYLAQVLHCNRNSICFAREKPRPRNFYHGNKTRKHFN